MPPAREGERVDVFVAASVEGLSRSAAKRHLEAGRIRIDGRPGEPSDKVRAGSVVEVEPLAPPPSRASPEPIPLAIVHEDEDLLVVDKPAGLVVHPAHGHWRGTLVNALLHHAHVEAGADPLRPGIVHRLDKGTSGLLVVTKTERARAALGRDFHDHRIERSYRAIVLGAPPATGTFQTLYGRHPKDRKRFSSRVREGRPATTRYRVIERFGREAALVEATLETGRTHQVRVHFSDAGFPLLADATYGRTPRAPALAAIARTLGRPALHAAVLGFTHPVRGEWIRFEAPLPVDLVDALDALRRMC